MSGDAHVRFYERLAVQFRRPTHPGLKPHLPWQGIAEDPNACGYSSNLSGFGPGCFIISSGVPWFAAIFHELGHQGQAFVDSDLIPFLYSCFTWSAGKFGEGDAQLLMQWSMREIMRNREVLPSTVAIVQKQVSDPRANALNALEKYAKGTDPYDDSRGDGIWEGVGFTLAEKYGGWDYLRRYVRSWRRDEYVMRLI